MDQEEPRAWMSDQAMGLEGAALVMPPNLPAWVSRRIDRAVALGRVTDVLAAAAAELAPAATLAIVCEAIEAHLAPTNVVLFKRVASRQLTLAWSAPGRTAASRLTALARAWERAARLVDEPLNVAEAMSDVACATARDDDRERLGLLYVESRRALDGGDHAVVFEVLRRLDPTFDRVLGATPRAQPEQVASSPR
jgi:hypothetical protein